METKMIKCVFYGSLRKPLYNYIRFLNVFGIDSIHYKRTTYIHGYELYSLGDFPGVKNGEVQKKIVVDLFEVTEEVYDTIRDMELSSGYYEDEIDFECQIHKIFIYKGKVNESQLVESGDWLKYSIDTGKYKIQKNEHSY